MHSGYCGTNRSAGIGKLMGNTKILGTQLFPCQIASNGEKIIGQCENNMQLIIVCYVRYL